jgi:hypothetical protein
LKHKIWLTALLWLASWVVIILLCGEIIHLITHRAEAKSVNPIAIQEQAVSTYSSSSVKEYVQNEAVIYGVNPELALCIVSHESQFVPTKLGPEKRGVSQGLWQIYSLAWPNITRAQTFDVVWSTNWALDKISNGQVHLWSTYHKYCSNIKVLL